MDEEVKEKMKIDEGYALRVLFLNSQILHEPDGQMRFHMLLDRCNIRTVIGLLDNVLLSSEEKEFIRIYISLIQHHLDLDDEQFKLWVKLQ